MNLFDSIAGGVPKFKEEEVKRVITPFVVAGEKISHVYKVTVSDNNAIDGGQYAVFSNKRVLVERRFSNDVNVTSYYYKNFLSWSMGWTEELSNPQASEPVLHITTAAAFKNGGSIHLSFETEVDFAKICSILNEYVLMEK